MERQMTLFKKLSKVSNKSQRKFENSFVEVEGISEISSLSSQRQEGAKDADGELNQIRYALDIPLELMRKSGELT